MVVFIMLCKVVLTFEPVDELLKFDHSMEAIVLFLKPTHTTELGF